MSGGTVIKVEPALMVFTPLALGKSSHHLFQMASGYDTDGSALPARLYVYCASIEIGLKAAILAQDCTPATKEGLKKLGHDLTRVVTKFEEVCTVSIFDDADRKAIDTINAKFKDKALEYFTAPMLGSVMRAYSDLPTIAAIHDAAGKVNAYIEGQEFFLHAKSSHKPTGGIICAV